MEYIRNDWMRPKTQRERDVMLRYGMMSRIITIGGYLIVTVTLVCYHSPLIFGFVTRTLTNLTDVGDRPFALQTIYLFDAYKSPVYELVALSQFLISAICSFCYTTMGTLFGVIVLHVSAQLENLHNRIPGMGNYGTVDFQVEFKFTIEEHDRLIRFVKLIESTFSSMLLEVVAGFSFLVCVQGYQIIIILGDDIQRPLIHVIVSICTLMYMIFIMFVYSAVGDILVTQVSKEKWLHFWCFFCQVIDYYYFYQVIDYYHLIEEPPIVQPFFTMHYYVQHAVEYWLQEQMIPETSICVFIKPSENIQYATYNCEWYKLKPREAVQFIPILVRSQRPLTITAGKFISLTLPTFATLLKTTAGYISFLLAVKD